MANPTQALAPHPSTPIERRSAGAVFLDRDGVINRRIVGDYVRTWEQFEFLPGAIAAIARLAQARPRIFVVTNQAGVGKGLMTLEDLDRVHARMIAVVEAGGGRIDAVYACPHTPADGCRCRKPQPGLGERALADFSDVDADRSVMVGDHARDLAFGRAVGLRTVLVAPDRSGALDADGWAPDLGGAAALLLDEWFPDA